MAIVSMSFAEMNPKSADEITYDNTTSGLEADNVQDAIDEVNDMTSVENIPVTFGTDWEDMMGRTVLKRIGKMIVLLGNFRGKPSTITSTTPTKILSFDPKFAPSFPVQIYGVFVPTDGAGAVSCMYVITSNGEVSVSQLQTGTTTNTNYCRCCLIWTID